MKDALGQEVITGDFVVFSKAKRFKLAVVTELFNNESINTIRVEFSNEREWNPITREWGVRRRKVTLARLKMPKGSFVRVDPNAHLTIDIQEKKHWSTTYADKKANEYLEGLQLQINIYDYLRANHALGKKLKLPEHLKL